jgi:predicted enzyme related to lactoylglutathione lyase
MKKSKKIYLNIIKAELSIMTTIVHFDLPKEDIKRAVNFYEKLFDWKN